MAGNGQDIQLGVLLQQLPADAFMPFTMEGAMEMNKLTAILPVFQYEMRHGGILDGL